jgi:hypothetical protein
VLGVVRLKQGELGGVIGDFDQAIEESYRSGDRSSMR